MLTLRHRVNRSFTSRRAMEYSASPMAQTLKPTTPPTTTAGDVLRKAVNALAIVPQTTRITYLARKTYNVLLHEAQAQGLEREVYRSPLDEIVKGIDFDSNDTGLVKKHLRGMVTTAVEWQSPTLGEGQAWNVCGLLAHAKLYKERGQVWVEWSYAPNLKHELLEPSVFARLRLEVLTQLRSHPAVALYEICSRYRDVGRTSRNAWRWWHPVLTGQPPDAAKLEKLDYRFFKRDTLKPAIAEVSSITDLEIELVEHKRGRFIDEIQFGIQQKRQASLPISEVRRPVDLSLTKRAEANGLQEHALEKLIDEFGEGPVEQMLPALERRRQSAFPQPLRDPVRYARALLSNAPAEPPVATAALTPPEPSAQSEVKSEWLAIWREQRVEAVKAEIASLARENLQQLLAEVETELEAKRIHPSVLRRLRQSGWTHPLVVMEVVRSYALGAYGEHWDHPTPEQLLDIAARHSGSPRR